MSATLQELMDDDREELLVKQWKGGLLEIKEFTVTDLCDEIHSQMYKYLKHIYNMKTQTRTFREQKEKLTVGHIIIQTDFAENYSIKHQNEVMAAHWMPSTGDSVTIYTSIVHYVEDEEQHTKAYAIVSDTMTHSSLEAQVFNSKIIDDLRANSLPIKHISLWTDGAAAHFKNRFSITALSFYDQIHEATAEWNFFESYHGKGPHDGIGALIKWNVYRRVLQGRATVRSALDLYKIAIEISKKTTVLYVSKNDIESEKAGYEKLWKGCRAAHSIQQCRSVKTLGHYRVALYHNTHDDTAFTNCNLEPRDLDSDEEPSSSTTIELSNEEDAASSLASGSDVEDVSVSDAELEECEDPDDITSVCERIIGSYVLVKYTGKRSVVHFAAVVEGNETVDGEKLININCLKSSGKKVSGDLTFVFPKNGDRDTVPEDMIVRNLPVPNIRRDTYIFENVSFPVNIQ